MMQELKSPYPYFGGKSTVAPQIWQALGDVPVFVDPFLGSAAVLLGRPSEHLATGDRIEVVNDLDGYIVNFWRATQADFKGVAKYADSPTFENDLHARHYWLVQQRSELVERLEGNPDYYDVKIAGWWVWGMANWIGGAFCGTDGPWVVVDGKLVKRDKGAAFDDNSEGISRQRLHAGNTGQGVGRRSLQSSANGEKPLYAYMRALAKRLERVRVMCGDWTRVCKPAVMWGLNVTGTGGALTGVVLDPPYAHSERDNSLYAQDHDVSAAVREFAVANGDNPNLRIVLCGYEGEHDIPDTWRKLTWDAPGGYANIATQGRGRDNKGRECLWLSPHCLGKSEIQQMSMF